VTTPPLLPLLPGQIDNQPSPLPSAPLKSTMPRPKKKRCCKGTFAGKAFKPTQIPMDELTKTNLFDDEVEALRLCDVEGHTQEQAGRLMGVSRGTVQRILTSARKKTASAIVHGEALILTDS